MSGIEDFAAYYRAQLEDAMKAAGMPPALQEAYAFESCIRPQEDGGKGLYILTRKADGARALMRTTLAGAWEDALEEGRLLQALDHPAIPKIYAMCEHGGRGYMVRAYVEGRTLHDILRTDGPMRAGDIYGIARKLCDALSYLHGLTPPIIHRDIKPHNIIVAPDGSLHLIDFGIARAYKEGQARDTAILLTDRYAAPEQYGFEQTTPQADIYALGMVLLFMATGDVDKTRLNERIRDRPLRRLIEGCIAFDPAERFRSADGIARYIRRNCGGRRRRALLALGLVAALAAASALPYTLGRRAGEAARQEAVYEDGYRGGYEAGVEAGHAAGYGEGHEAGTGEGYAAGFAAAPGLDMAETPFDPMLGNLRGNIGRSNSGHAVRSEDAVYYSGQEGIYRMDPETAHAELLLDAKNAGSLNYYEGWLYYCTSGGIFRTNPATRETELFCDVRTESLYIVDGAYYFRNAADDSRLYEIDTESREVTRLNDITSYFYLNIAGGRMYFTAHDMGRRLYSCNLDGSDLRIVHDNNSEWLCIYDGKIYCFAMADNGGYLTRMDLDGGNVERLLHNNVNYVNVTPGGIFYANGNGRELEWMSFDGNTRHRISTNKCSGFVIAGQWIFYVNSDDGDAFWRVRIDGEDDRRVAK